MNECLVLPTIFYLAIMIVTAGLFVWYTVADTRRMQRSTDEIRADTARLKVETDALIANSQRMREGVTGE